MYRVGIGSESCSNPIGIVPEAAPVDRSSVQQAGLQIVIVQPPGIAASARRASSARSRCNSSGTSQPKLSVEQQGNKLPEARIQQITLTGSDSLQVSH